MTEPRYLLIKADYKARYQAQLARKTDGTPEAMAELDKKVSAAVEVLSSVGGSVQAEGDTTKLKFAGFNLVIENPAGTIREGVDETGKAWRTEFAHAYGEITGSLGVDGDPVDVYVGPDEGAREVYIVRQMKRKKWDQFDEDKCFIGFASMEEAKQAYLNHYDDPRFFGGIIAMPIEEFRTKVYATKNNPQMLKALLFVKAHVAAHSRTLKNGKVVRVDAYSTKVVAQAKQAPAKKPHATDTEAFKRWFGDSKVVDDKGKPLVVYHGTPNDFSEFLPGAYFTEHPQEAGAYTGASATMARGRMTGKFTIGSDGGKSDGANVRYAYDGLAELESPQVGEVVATDDRAYRYEGGNKWTVLNDLEPDFSADASDNDHVVVQKADTSESAAERIAEYEEAVVRATPGGDGGGNVRPVYLSIKNPIRLSALEGNRLAQKAGNDREYIADQIAKWEAQGYDGIVTESDEASNIPESREGLGGIPQQWVAFRPEQAKSAIGNNGGFDATHPDMTKALIICRRD
ncbi:hypothetical protein [Pseudomonas sp.]|uniref:ADP-ribosyltransferase-containing protein n=1 Tax=Pseudomonas sp. TaxID=306 RepID=UPI002587AD9E|nr:hypothetical protein [Pseudomonas sp.]